MSVDRSRDSGLQRGAHFDDVGHHPLHLRGLREGVVQQSGQANAVRLQRREGGGPQGPGRGSGVQADLPGGAGGVPRPLHPDAGPSRGRQAARGRERRRGAAQCIDRRGGRRVPVDGLEGEPMVAHAAVQQAQQVVRQRGPGLWRLHGHEARRADGGSRATFGLLLLQRSHCSPRQSVGPHFRPAVHRHKTGRQRDGIGVGGGADGGVSATPAQGGGPGGQGTRRRHIAARARAASNSGAGGQFPATSDVRPGLRQVHRLLGKRCGGV
mmetsp:Transcript_74911/g.126151  ORF Transcript_74911/g.126151 Transcript_74911/m.126151 type:complete len:268 (+) Transcript_74911:1108-1911(+)